MNFTSKYNTGQKVYVMLSPTPLFDWFKVSELVEIVAVKFDKSGNIFYDVFGDFRYDKNRTCTNIPEEEVFSDYDLAVAHSVGLTDRLCGY